MKLTTTCFLYARSGRPGTGATAAFYVAPGTAVEIAGAYTGDSLDGNSVWFLGADGHYYWSGGFAEIEFELPDAPAADSRLLGQALDYFFRKYEKPVPGFNGLYASYQQGTPALVFQSSCSEEARRLVPATLLFKGHAIRSVVEQNEAMVRQESADWVYPGIPGALHPGCSISTADAGDNWGTCGFKGIARIDDVEYPCVVTAYHVAAPDLLMRGIKHYKLGDPGADLRMLYMPATVTGQAREIGNLFEGKYNAYTDAAVVLLQESNLVGRTFQAGPDEIQGIKDVTGDAAYERRVVTIYGSRSGTCTSAIASTDAMTKVQGEDDYKRKLIAIKKIARGGDSGSAVLMDGKLIGLVIGSDANFTYLIPIHRILFSTSATITIL